MPFEVICEVEPATRPDLMGVRHQVGILSSIATSFLIPDNHLGRATVSSIAAAHEVARMGARPIACLNARDRNVLGFQRDLLTAAAYGVDELLLVHGDRPASGSRTGDLTVRTMLETARRFPEQHPTAGPWRLAVTTGLRPLPAWKREADALFVQVAFSLEPLLRWREAVAVDVPVYAGVMVVASAAMAHKLGGVVPELAAPPELVARLADDPMAGVEAACQLVEDIGASGAFDGVHLVPVRRYRDVAARLEGRLTT